MWKLTCVSSFTAWLLMCWVKTCNVNKLERGEFLDALATPSKQAGISLESGWTIDRTWGEIAGYVLCRMAWQCASSALDRQHTALQQRAEMRESRERTGGGAITDEAARVWSHPQHLANQTGTDGTRTGRRNRPHNKVVAPPFGRLALILDAQKKARLHIPKCIPHEHAGRCRLNETSHCSSTPGAGWCRSGAGSKHKHNCVHK
jgi:hypothetical protein